MIYKWKLLSLPAEIPYEDLSKWYVWKLQNQRRYLIDYTVWTLVGNICRSIWSTIHGYIFRHGYYERNGKVYNKYTDTPYYVHSTKGTYIIQNESCCDKCVKTIIDYGDIK